MAEIVLQVVALGFQDIEPFVLDLPASPATSGELGDVVTPDRQIGDEAVAIGQLAASVADLDHQPVDGDRVSIAA